MNAIVDNAGVGAETVRTCPLCGGAPRPLYADLVDRLYAAPGHWTLQGCAACGSAWLDPRPLAGEIPKLYAAYFTHAEPGAAPHGRRTLRLRVRDAVLAARLGYAPTQALPGGRLLATLGPLREVVEGSVLWLRARPGGRLLDVGCGNGDFLRRMRDQGWDVEGVEPDASAALQARRAHGLRVHDGGLDTLALAPESFDVVTLNHVIEHVIDPAALVRAAARMLRPGGELRIVTPNLASRAHRIFGRDWVHLDPPRHLALFTASTLQNLVAACGLERIVCRSTARDARWAFAASALLRRQGRLEGGHVRAARGLRLRALAFQWREHGVAGAGEELWLAASRSGTAAVS